MLGNRSTYFSEVERGSPGQLANFGVRIVDYIIHAETETELTHWHFPATYIYFCNSATIFFSNKLIIFR